MFYRLRRSLGLTELLGLILLGLYITLSRMSRLFIYGEGHLARPILSVVCILLIAFLIYTLAVALVMRRHTKVRLVSVLFFAIIFRIVFLSSDVIQEDDIYRYIWDGQVSVNGINPYRYAPADVVQFEQSPDRFSKSEQSELAVLSSIVAAPAGKISSSTAGYQSPRTVFTRINHPEVPTIYPPFAQHIFALMQRIIPWSVLGARAMSLFFDGLCIAFLIALLKYFKLPLSRVLIYAWSPVVLKEFTNSGHMDTIAIAAVLLCLLFFVYDRWVLASISLAFGILSKYYPLVLIPIIGERLWRKDRRIALKACAVLLVTLLFCAAPFLKDGTRMFHGLGTYAASWELNAGLFSVLKWVTTVLFGNGADTIARVVMAVLYLLTLGWVLRRQHASADPMVVTKSSLIAIGMLFLLSPAQYPWYICWLIPLLCLHPWRPWILLTGLILFYYLGFFVEYHYAAVEADKLWNLIKLVEYMPFFGFLAWELYHIRRRIT